MSNNSTSSRCVARKLQAAYQSKFLLNHIIARRLSVLRCEPQKLFKFYCQATFYFPGKKFDNVCSQQRTMPLSPPTLSFSCTPSLSLPHSPSVSVLIMHPDDINVSFHEIFAQRIVEFAALAVAPLKACGFFQLSTIYVYVALCTKRKYHYY